MKKFLLIDDHEVVRSGISGLLSEIYKPCEIHEAFDSNSATEKLKLSKYDLIMMDIQMPNSDSLGLMEYINVRYPEAKVLIFSMSSENIYAKRFLKVGAKGFLSKDSSLDEIKKAINLLLNNRRYVSDALAESLAFGAVTDSTENPFEKLSHREFEITSLLLSGLTVSEISKSLNLQTSTVGTHKSRIFEKLGIENILQLKELATSFNL
jgi:two-component system, NarL family, invasion response regulator UvrY